MLKGYLGIAPDIQGGNIMLELWKTMRRITYFPKRIFDKLYDIADNKRQVFDFFDKNLSDIVSKYNQTINQIQMKKITELFGQHGCKEKIMHQIVLKGALQA